ncbi:MAG TPA: hypothetical protein VKX49_01140 [Bryobacteraceae bacterium]|nr:hypothetical protein [Bryobacteraceae bacterium]
MRSLILAGACLTLVCTAFAQGRGQYWSLGGFGNVVYPGTGHAPAAAPPGGFGFSGARNGFAGRPGFGGVPAAHPQHRRTAIVPYPVFYTGYGYGPGYGYDPSLGYAPGYGDQPPVVNAGSIPPVIINQNFAPPQANPVVREYAPSDQGGAEQQSSSLKMYQAPTPGQMTSQAQYPASSGQATLYLIAFKDHTIVQALGYWMEGSTLHYVTLDHDVNQVSLDLIDRDLSQRLNSERNIEFRLPPAR